MVRLLVSWLVVIPSSVGSFRREVTLSYIMLLSAHLFYFYLISLQEMEMALKKDCQDGRGQVVKEAGVPRAPTTAATSKTNSSPASSAKKE